MEDKMTKTLKFFLGLFVMLFIVAFVFTIIFFLSGGQVPTWLKWADIILLVLIILCFPAITLSEAKRTKDEQKKWVKQNGIWKIKKD